MQILSSSPAESTALGIKLGRALMPGDFIALYGDLGAGKTHLAKAVAAGIGVGAETPVTSPTFTILNTYPARIPFYHFDLYRLDGEDALEGLGFEEYFDGDGACLVEWAERLGRYLPPQYLELRLEAAGESERLITLTPHGKRYQELVSALAR